MARSRYASLYPEALPQLLSFREGRAQLGDWPEWCFVPLAGATVGPGYLKVTYPKRQVRDAPSITVDGELAGFARVICFDKRGMGLSDRVEAGTLEDRMDDVRAVMDATGSRRAALMGSSEGGPLSLLFAATYPERNGYGVAESVLHDEQGRIGRGIQTVLVEPL